MSTVIESCKKGSDMTLYYNTGTGASPTWVEHLGMVEDLDVNESDELSELSGRRASRKVKEYNQGDTELSISGSQIHDPGYEGWQILNAARNDGVSKDLLVLSGSLATAGSYGWRGDFWNSDRSLKGPSSGDMVNAVNLQPAAPCHADHQEVRVVKVATPGTAADFDPAA